MRGFNHGVVSCKCVISAFAAHLRNAHSRSDVRREAGYVCQTVYRACSKLLYSRVQNACGGRFRSSEVSLAAIEVCLAMYEPRCEG